MIYEFLFPLSDSLTFLNVFKYITVRGVGAFFTGLFIYLVFGKSFLKFLIKKEIGQFIREEGPQSHHSKKGTPTMGGILIIIAVVFSSLLWGNWSNPYLWLLNGVLLAFAAIGFVDDYQKVVKKHNLGLRGKHKLLLQFLIAFGFAAILIFALGFSTDIYFPFFKNLHPNISYAFILWTGLVIVGCSNAVNLTDGLDGLVAMPNIIAFATYGILVYVMGNVKMSDYLYVPYIAGMGEIAIFCAAVTGAVMGFLWFNSYPAQVFMGDVGSLALGGALGAVAILAKAEILLILIGGIFVLEAVSVITQVISFKLTGKRIFRMAPLHHHFELKGWKEPKVIIRFWIISFVLALLSLSTLKIR